MPDIYEQFNRSAEPDSVALDTLTHIYMKRRLPASYGVENYLPYIGPIPAPVIECALFERYAATALVELHACWMSYLEGRHNG